MAADTPKVVPLTCHGHSRPVTHLNYSAVVEEDQYYLISASKDNNPMLRDGITGDWIGTFIGHKGAVWSSRISSDATLAATGSADFTAKIWDPHTGECLHTLQHNHIVKSVSFPQQSSPTCVATGSLDKKLHIYDITQSYTNGDNTVGSPNGSPTKTTTNGSTSSPTSKVEGFEIGPGVHTAPIKSVVWMVDYNILTTAAEDKTLRWWDLRSRRPVASFVTSNPITSCELNTPPSSTSTSSPTHHGTTGGDPTGLLSVAAGDTCYFFSGSRPGELTKSVTFDHDVASVAVNVSDGRFVTGGMKDTWVRVWDWNGLRGAGEVETEQSKNLIETQKGHHGPIWSISYSPDGKLYATGSEDGTIKLWKACKEQYGLWRV